MPAHSRPSSNEIVTVSDVGRSVRFGWPSMPAHSRPSSNEIVIANPAKLGEGGMGEVWEATDTKQVALKILPEAFASDPDRLARFQREA
jgi:serine/threonine protein kinase